MNFFVQGDPIPQGSMRAMVRGKRAVMFSANPRLHAWRELVSRVARVAMLGATPSDGPVAINLSFTMPRPKTAKANALPITRRGDLDKLIRAVLDALTGVVYVDDSQVIVISARKRYAPAGESGAVGVNVRVRATRRQQP